MKIAFIFTYQKFVSSDGVFSQAKSWKEGLESLGHEVDLINNWDNYDWKSYDSIVLFSFTPYMVDAVRWLYDINPNIVSAPIFDPEHSTLAYKIYARWGCERLKLVNKFSLFRNIRDKVKVFLCRTNFEKSMLCKVFGIKESKCRVVPLSYKESLIQKRHLSERQPFCLHVSLLCDRRKNVQRLIEASKKYKFPLVLCGKIRSDKEQKILDSWIDGDTNITFKGFVSNEELKKLYNQAKVFALPSIYEGVGLVALDAAACGCDIVLTNIGGPREYYNNMAKFVNPYDIDDIGANVLSLIKGNSYQPSLSNYIQSNFSIERTSILLEQALADAIK